MMIKIEKLDMPLPPRKIGGGSPKDPTSFSGRLRSLNLGKAITVKGVARSNVSTTCNIITKETGFKFTTRKLEDGSIGVWRIK